MSIPQNLAQQLKIDDWKEKRVGVYASTGILKPYDKDFRLFTRRTNLEDFFKKSSRSKTQIPCKYCISDTDPNAGMGNPNIKIGPGPIANNNQYVCLEQLESFQKLKPNIGSLVIGFDSEYYGDPRVIISWQFSVVVGDDLYEYVFISKNGNKLSLEVALARILDDIGVYKPVDARSVNIGKKSESDITVVCHSGLADWSTLDQSGKYHKDILKCCSHVQGGLVTLRPVKFAAKSVAARHGHNAKYYKISLTIADTMCHAPSKKRTLMDLGEVIGIPKIELPTKPINYIERMDQLMIDNPRLFFEYASQDSIVALLYLASLYGYNHQPSVTLSAAGAKLMKEMMMHYLQVASTEGFERKYRGLHRVKHGLIPRKNGPGFVASTSLEPISDKANTIHNYFSAAYKGGYNSCSEVGYYSNKTYDYDLRNAYPTAMCVVPDIDWDNPIKYEIKNEVLTLQKWHVSGDVYNPLMPFAGYVRFEFPENVKYPCIPVNVDGIPVYPLTSDGLDGVYACGPELYLALRLGAKVWCETGYVLNALERQEGVSHSLRTAVYTLVKDRARAEKICGKGSLEELILKVIVNSCYGKTAQNVIEKHTWSACRDEMENIGFSSITNPVYACMTTSIVRAILIAVQNQATERGYLTHSVTTDGFITDMPEDVLKGLDLFGIRGCVEKARSFLTDGEDTELWTKKHEQDDLLNFTTRGNVSLHSNGVCAHNGVKSGYEPDSYADRLWLAKSALKRTGPVIYPERIWTTFKEVVRGKEFKVVEKSGNKRMDFDMKRKPVESSVLTMYPEVVGVKYEIANISSEPYKTVEEFRKYRRIKENMNVIRTADDWEEFFRKVNYAEYGVRPRDMEWAKLNSCIMGHRAGLWTIPALSKGTVAEKCKWLNTHNKSKHTVTESDWKHARESKRQANMLPRHFYEDLLDELINDYSE